MVLPAAAAVPVFALYLVTELRSSGRLGFPLDDPWIHLTFARNIAHGWGFVFNRGHWVAGSTAPLWTMVLAFFHLFTSSATAMVLIAKLLGMFFLAVAAACAAGIAHQLTGRRFAALGAGLAVATLAPMGWAMMSGMEVTLSAALTLAGIYYYLAPGRGWKAHVSWVLFGLAAYARPESLVLPGLVLLDLLLQRILHRRGAMPWRGLAAWLVTVLPWFIFNAVVSGSPFPQTFTAKSTGAGFLAAVASGNTLTGLSRAFGGLPAYYAEFVVFLWQANPVLAMLVPVGLIAMVYDAVRRDRGNGFLVSLVVLGYVPLMGLAAPAFGPAFQGGRYVGNVTALCAVVAVLGISVLARRLRSRRAGIALSAAVGGLAAFNMVSTNLAGARNTAQAASSINRMQVELGHWLADNTPDSATLGCNDIGAVGYFSRRHIIDLAGLVTPGILRYRFIPGGRGRFITDVRPDFLVIFPAAFPELKEAAFLEPLQVIDIPDNTASLYDIRPVLRTWAGILVLDAVVPPVRAPLVVFRCNWYGS